MRLPPRFSILAETSVVIAVATALMSPGRLAVDHARSELFRPYARAVNMAQDQRASADVFAQRAGIDLAEFRHRHGASGLIRCGAATGSGQLTLTKNLITTAAHVFIAPRGALRSPSCTFEPAGAPGTLIAIDMDSILTGSAKPMEQRATLDWAVARLVAPLEGITPYAPGAPIAIPSPVLMYAGGNGRAATMGIEQCSLRHVTAVSPEGIREVSFDCSAAHGGSGAALLNDKNEIVGIFVGYRSVDPKRAQPFSGLHYNFAITIEGPFYQALLRAAASAR